MFRILGNMKVVISIEIFMFSDATLYFGYDAWHNSFIGQVRDVKLFDK